MTPKFVLDDLARSAQRCERGGNCDTCAEIVAWLEGVRSLEARCLAILDQRWRNSVSPCEYPWEVYGRETAEQV